ncbi:MAG: flagellar hook-length control protein FliK [Azoarcus sp.]|nr:flagellar hook-length control protein FliK [Azoarcus sp.]
MAHPLSNNMLNLSASTPMVHSEASRPGSRESDRAGFPDALRERLHEPGNTRPDAPTREASAPPVPTGDKADAAAPAPSPTPAPPTDDTQNENTVTAAPPPGDTAIAATLAATIAALLSGIAAPSPAAANGEQTDANANGALAALLAQTNSADTSGEAATEGDFADTIFVLPKDSAEMDAFPSQGKRPTASAAALAVPHDERAAALKPAEKETSATAAVAALARRAEISIMGPQSAASSAITNTIASADPNPNPIPILNALHAPALAQAAAPPAVAVPSALGQPGWAEEVGNRVLWMLGRGESKAELVLTPPHLGRVEVSITMNGDQSTAQFVASSQAARDALEQALPRLREMLAQAGVSLGEASVGASPERQTQGEAEGDARAGSGAPAPRDADRADATGVASALRVIRENVGLVNTFA